MRSMRNAKVKKNIIGDVTDCPNLAPLVPTEERVIAKHRFHLLLVVADVVMRSAKHRLANKHKK